MISGRPVQEKTVQRARRYAKSKLGRTVPRGSRNASNNAIPLRSRDKQAWVEIQTPEGNWSKYKDSTDAETSTQCQIAPLPSHDCLPHLDLQEPSTLSHISSPYTTLTVPNSVTFTPYTSSSNNSGLWDQEYSNLDFQPGIWTISSPPITTENALSFFHPTLIEGLKNLPSVRFLSSWDSFLANTGPGYPRPRHQIAIGALTQTLAQLGTFSQIAGFSIPDLSRTFKSLATVIPVQGLIDSHQNSLDMIPADGILSPTLYRLLLYSVINGHVRNRDLTLKCIAKLLDHLEKVKFPFSKVLQTFSEHAAKAFAESLSRAAIQESENRVLGTLLDTGYVDVNSLDIGNRSAIEYALDKKNADGTRLLFKAGAQPKKYHVRSHIREDDYHGGKKPGDWLLYKVLSRHLIFSRETMKRLAWLGLIDHLLNVGASLTPTNFSDIHWSSNEGMDIAYRIASTFTLCQHYSFFAYGCLWTIAHHLSDDRATEVIRRLASDCAKKHGGSCLHDLKGMIYIGLLRAAERRLCNFVKSLLSYYVSAPPPDSFVLSLLCASIKGGSTELINFVLLYRPNINGIDDGDYDIPVRLPSIIKSHMKEMVRTSPFAEAIKANNEPLIHSFEQAGILGSLGDVQRAALVITAASEAGNVSYLRRLLRLLSVSSDLERLPLEDLLNKAIVQRDEALIVTLLEAGAFIEDFSLGFRLPSDPKPIIKPLVTALNLCDARLVRILLNADNYGILSKRVIQSAFEWGEKSIIDDIMMTIPSKKIVYSSHIHHLTSADYGFELHEDLSKDNESFEIARSLRGKLKNKEIFQYFLDSKLATREILTECLVVALHEDDRDMLQRLLDSGADVKDSLAWKVASKWRPHMISVLAENLAKRKGTVLTKGMGTGLLKEVIKSGSGFAAIAESQIRSGLVDIFHAGGVNNYDPSPAITPLGVAIVECGSRPSFKPNVVIALLNAKCDPNSIVEWDPRAGSNQTALLKAIEVDALELVKLLIDFGARVNEPPRFRVKQTPLQKAAGVGSLDIVRLLLGRGAEANGDPAFSRGGTALQFAAISGNCNIAAELLNHGAQLYAKPSTCHGRWPLEGAAEHGRLDMIEFLWRANGTVMSNPGFEGKNCQRAMELAIKNGHSACKDLLVELSGHEYVDRSKLASRPMYIDV